MLIAISLCVFFSVVALVFALASLLPEGPYIPVTLRFGVHKYKRGAWMRSPQGKPTTWAIVRRYVVINRGYLFNV